TGRAPRLHGALRGKRRSHRSPDRPHGLAAADRHRRRNRAARRPRAGDGDACRMNVLILSAAAKVLLVEAFRDAVADRGGRVFAADIAPDSAALYIADRGLILPRSQAPEFIPDLKRVCREHRIGLVVPTRDAELAVLAPWRVEFAAAGTTILVAAPKTIALCQDKQRFAGFCEAESFPIARTYGPDELPARFPIFVRPTTGAGGIGARRIDDVAQWR